MGPATAAAAQLRADPVPAALPSPLQAAQPQSELRVEAAAKSLPEEADRSPSLSESDSLRNLARQILQADSRSGATPDPPTQAAENGNGHREQSEELVLKLQRDVLLQAKRCSLILHFEDMHENVLGSVESRFELDEGEVVGIVFFITRGDGPEVLSLLKKRSTRLRYR